MWNITSIKCTAVDLLVTREVLTKKTLHRYELPQLRWTSAVMSFNLSWRGMLFEKNYLKLSHLPKPILITIMRYLWWQQSCQVDPLPWLSPAIAEGHRPTRVQGQCYKRFIKKSNFWTFSMCSNLHHMSDCFTSRVYSLYVENISTTGFFSLSYKE